MTREEAIDIANRVRESNGRAEMRPVDPHAACSPVSAHHVVDEGGALVDSLAALGLLKLDRPSIIHDEETGHSDTLLRALKSLVSKLERRDPETMETLRRFIEEQNAPKRQVTPQDLREPDDTSPVGFSKIVADSLNEPPSCEPPPEHRERAGSWHWLQRGEYRAPAQWHPHAPEQWSKAGKAIRATDLASEGWRYLAPCEEPRTGYRPGDRVITTRGIIVGNGLLARQVPKGTYGEVIAIHDDGWVNVRLSGEAGVRLFKPETLALCDEEPARG